MQQILRSWSTFARGCIFMKHDGKDAMQKLFDQNKIEKCGNRKHLEFTKCQSNFHCTKQTLFVVTNETCSKIVSYTTEQNITGPCAKH